MAAAFTLVDAASEVVTVTNLHVHVECDHQIKFCKKCDVVWCGECSKEWSHGATTTVSSHPKLRDIPKHSDEARRHINGFYTTEEDVPFVDARAPRVHVEHVEG